MRRKLHVSAQQWELGAFVSARDMASLVDVAGAFDISEATARRKLDGLVAQGLLEVRRADRRAPRLYAVPGTLEGAA